LSHLSNKQQIYSWVHALTTPDATARRSLLESKLHPEVVWRVSHPVNTLRGIAAVESGLLEPLHRAFLDLERRDDILVGSQTPTGDMVALHGHFYGSFGQDLFGIPATHGLVRLRYGQFFRLEGGMVTAAFVLLDLIDLMRQAGVSPFLSSAGAEGLSVAPRTGDGIRLGLEDETSATISRNLVFAMGEGLGNYDQKSLASMGMKRFWSNDMHWYGPSGIGSTRGLKGFEDFHQRPFLKAFPDRSGSFSQVQRFGRIADATYVASGGFPSLGATHLGEYLGTPATGKHIGMRVMDFWRREGSLLAENWVLIDLPDLFLQFGVDLFAHLKGRHVT
jgi:predicted ester cyclase